MPSSSFLKAAPKHLPSPSVAHVMPPLRTPNNTFWYMGPVARGTPGGDPLLYFFSSASNKIALFLWTLPLYPRGACRCHGEGRVGTRAFHSELERGAGGAAPVDALAAGTHFLLSSESPLHLQSTPQVFVVQEGSPEIAVKSLYRQRDETIRYPPHLPSPSALSSRSLVSRSLFQ